MGNRRVPAQMRHGGELPAAQQTEGTQLLSRRHQPDDAGGREHYDGPRADAHCRQHSREQLHHERDQASA